MGESSSAKPGWLAVHKTATTSCHSPKPAF